MREIEEERQIERGKEKRRKPKSNIIDLLALHMSDQHFADSGRMFV